MAKRRQRYTVTLGTGLKQVILAPSRESAIAHYRNMGHRVAACETGDYRRKPVLEARKEVRREIYSQLRPTGARPSTLNVHSAARELDLRFPYEISLQPHKSFTAGSANKVWIGGLDAPARVKHIIKVKDWLPVREMGEVIWHELTHAKQLEDLIARMRERNPNVTNRQVKDAWKKLYRDGTAYYDKVMERQARAAEPNNNRLPLAR